MAASKFGTHQLTATIALPSIVFLILFCIYGRYANEAHPTAISDFANVSRNYPILLDIHTLLLVGFGFLITFLRRYGFSSLAINLMIVAFVLEFAILLRGFLSTEFSNSGYFTISLKDVARADYTATAVLITFGAVVGKLTPIQHVIFAFLETIAQVLNEILVIRILGVGDVGGSIIVHFFGAIFGVVVARLIFKPQHINSEHQGSIYHSDMFAFLGTVILWALWPSFNSIFAVTSAEQNRAVLNTLLALIASTLTTFLLSQAFHAQKRFNIKHIASASLSGGVASGVVATLILSPFPAILLGILAGTISMIGFHYITPFLSTKLNIHDTRGVLSLHALPAIVGVLFNVAFLFLVQIDVYGNTITNIYPQHRLDTRDGRHPSEQALWQLAGLGITFAVALVSGIITGVVLRLPIWKQVPQKEFYADGEFFDVPEDYDFTTRVTSHIERVELTEHTERTRLTNSEQLPAATA